MPSLLELATIQPLVLYRGWRLRDRAALEEFAAELAKLARNGADPHRAIGAALRDGEGALRAVLGHPTAEKDRHIAEFFAEARRLALRQIKPRPMTRERSRAA